MRRSITLGILMISGCGGGGGGSSVQSPPPIVDEAIGGFWQGVDSDGDTILALSTDSGAFHWMATTGEQGFGTASVDGSEVTLNYTLVAASQIGFTLGDGSDSATCSGTGTVQERQTLSINANCTTSLGGTFANFVPLIYNPLYDMDSSFPAVAGNYIPDTHIDPDTGLRDGLMTIDGNGVVFEQDAVSGCVINGQMSVIDAAYNAYAASLTFSNCVGGYFRIDNADGRLGPDPVVEVVVPNGTSLTGLAILGNAVPPGELDIALNGQLAGTGEILAVVLSLTRI